MMMGWMKNAAVGAILAGLVACGGSAESGEAETGAPAERAARPATSTPPATRDLVVPPPSFASFDAALSGSHEQFVASMGGELREVSGTGASYEGTDSRTYVFTTDRPIEEVRDAYVQALRQAGMPVGGFGDTNTGEIEDTGLGFQQPPEQLEQAVEQYGLELPPGFLDYYRRAYPVLRDLRVREVEFQVMDADGAAGPGGAPPARYRDVEIRITRPVVDPVTFDIHDQTAIIYTIFDMERTS
jgi:hypothetical protein